jgi:hypothetical protein
MNHLKNPRFVLLIALLILFSCGKQTTDSKPIELYQEFISGGNFRINKKSRPDCC